MVANDKRNDDFVLEDDNEGRPTGRLFLVPMSRIPAVMFDRLQWLTFDLFHDGSDAVIPTTSANHTIHWQ